MAQAGYTPIRLYYSTTASAVPDAANLAAGELALNIADMKLYCENSSGVVTLLASSGGASGDVVGPASATDNAVVRFDGTTGKLVQNSGVLIADDGTTVISVNSATDALRITQTGAGNALVVEDSANPDSTPFVVDASGNVGVGVTPDVKFVVSGSGITSRIESVAATGVLQFNRCNGSIASPTAVTLGATLNQIKTFGYDGAAYIESARIEAIVDGTPGTNDMPGRLVFSTTADGASSPTERMRITNSGSVGVGGTPGADTFFVLSGTYPSAGTNSFVFQMGGTSPSTTTNVLSGYRARLNTQAATYTLSNLRVFDAGQGTFGASSTVTNQYGFWADSSLTGATNNYGFYSNIASGTGRWNFYANGTAENYLGGNLKIGGTADRGTTAGTNHLSLFNGTAPAGTLTNGVTLYSSSGDLFFMDSGGNGFKVGYRNIPPVGTKTGSYTLAVGDVGEYVQVGSGGSITIPDATFAEGDVISIFNNTTGNITITCTITTAYIAGTDADKASVTLATRGVATILFISSTVCVISGNVT